jgi:NET1-associated nuclear protein 1 (U3 small nucleolar RNA-associated protein 17)
VSASVTVWDLVDDELSYTHSVDLYTPKFTHTSSLIHLAVNTHDNTFAVAFPDIQVNALPPRLANIKAPKDTKATSKVLKARSKIIIFDPSTPKPVYDFSLTAVAMSLLPTLNGSGYITLDSAAELRIINPKARAAIPLFAPIAEPKQSLATTEDIEADVADMDIDDEEEVVVPEAVENDEIEDMIEDTENDKPVVRPEHLAEIFDAGHSYAAQSMRELFSSVVDLYARKPRVRWEQDLTGTA